MAPYAELYRQAYATLGLDLTERDGITEQYLSRFERKMKFRLPMALRQYYLVAGNEEEFNDACSRLLPPAEWYFDSNRLVFMEDDEGAIVWGVDLVKRPPQNPPVFCGVNEDTIEWHVDCEQSSIFLTTMLYWQGTYGGAMPSIGTVAAPEQLRERLDAEWSFAGQVTSIRAYSRFSQVVCLAKSDTEWRLFAGASSNSTLSRIAHELGVKWDRSHY